MTGPILNKIGARKSFSNVRERLAKRRAEEKAGYLERDNIVELAEDEVNELIAEEEAADKV